MRVVLISRKSFILILLNILHFGKTFNVSTTSGSTTPMQLTLTTPIWMPHKRFFVAVIGLTSGLYLATDKTNATPVCRCLLVENICTLLLPGSI